MVSFFSVTESTTVTIITEHNKKQDGNHNKTTAKQVKVFSLNTLPLHGVGGCV